MFLTNAILPAVFAPVASKIVRPQPKTSSNSFGPWVPGRSQELVSRAQAQAREAAALQAEANKPINLYPWASSENSANHIHFFLTKPAEFVSAVKATYNAQATPQLKKAYAADIAKFLNELNAVNNTLYIQKLNEAGLGWQGYLATYIDPTLVDFYYVNYLNQKPDEFLKTHLANIQKLPPEAQGPAIEQLRRLVSDHMPDGWFDKVSSDNQMKYLELIEPEALEEITVAQANVAANQQATKFMGVAILGVFGFYLVSKMFEGKRR